VAVTGALFQSRFSDRLDQLMGGASKSTSDKLFEAVSSGQGDQLGHGAQATKSLGYAHDAFIHALVGSMKLSLAVVVGGLALAMVLLKGGLPRRHAERTEPEAVAEPLGAQ
jgi:hypothetical protein